MDTLLISNRIYLNSEQKHGFISGGILISHKDGKVSRIFSSLLAVDVYLLHNEAEVHNFGDLVLMPGLIDSHVHINEPGRTEWEGFHTATKAAAAGGFTTICDMPLNSIPPTTTLANLHTKITAARGKIFTDVAFWGGVVPGNASELKKMIHAGVVGFKCFLCPSGVDEFQHVEEDDLHQALKVMEGTGSVLAFHAEMECAESPSHGHNPKKYATFLHSRPDQMEADAIELVSTLSQQYNVPCHIVHLSAARALPSIRAARRNGAKLTVETCHHYLSITAEDIPDARTEYKCCPPIRGKTNQEQLWQAIRNGDIDMVVSDHSPSTPDMKLLTSGKHRGDFLKAWGGISSVQFGLPLFWTNCRRYGLDIADLVRLLCTEPARMCGLDNVKGRLEVGYDGDVCVWDPADTFTVTQDVIEFRNKTSPYVDQKLRGVVHASFVRGYCVYRRTEKFGAPVGDILLKRPNRPGSKTLIIN
ncbi:allantoinase, mitochondrial [Toxorhynchites rutilus septentrionalis]|uniref:allantoinase, mitochondrial n=1 Tax=Toxorhynchites rutilus septentrionalis TaxID=329112 RepID=UPI0024784136|nr:allantoinase, mitochondrial [Toxorhynchites rutilus septentrionalis]